MVDVKICFFTLLCLGVIAVSRGAESSPTGGEAPLVTCAVMRGIEQTISDTADFYQLPALEQNALLFALVDGGAATVGGFEVALITDNGTVVQTFPADNDPIWGSNSSSIVGYRLPASDEYFIRVTKDQTGDIPYQLWTWWEGPFSVPTTETEPNNDLATAADLDRYGVGALTGTDVDYWRVNVPAQDSVASVVTACLAPPTGQTTVAAGLKLVFRNSTGESILSVNGGSRGRCLNIRPQNSGEHYFSVEASGTAGSYVLAVSYDCAPSSQAILSVPTGGIFRAVLPTLTTDSLVNCSRFNALGSGIIPADCSFAQRQYFGGMCVLPCPDGYTHTASCTCEKGSTEIDCSKYGASSPPDTCPPGRELFNSGCLKSCPNGFTRTASCTCQKGSTRTDCTKYAANTYVPKKCPNGREYYDGQCWLTCPPGYARTASCTCTRGSDEVNCEVYNKNRYLPTKCPCGREYYGSTCVRACPAGYTRDAGCSCKKGELITDCCAFGFRQELQCSGNKTKVNGLCYATALGGGAPTAPDSCPDGMEVYASGCYGKCWPGYARTASCTCSSQDLLTDCNLYGQAAPVGTTNGPTCDDNSDLLGGICYETKCPQGKVRMSPCTCSDSSVITDCMLYGDPRPIGDELGPQCESDADLFGNLCYASKCEPGSHRTAACTCDDLIMETNCTKYGDFKPIGDPLGPGCSSTKDLYEGLCYPACTGGKTRTASCTCSDYDIKIDCQKYGDARGPGDALGPRCLPGYDKYAALCYKESCPSGYVRAGTCECRKSL